MLDGNQRSSDATTTGPGPTWSPIVELRQYTLHPGMRDTLIALFDREFVETQEEAGMKIIGQFRDLDDPNRFVWLRGFADMASRGRALTAFYVDGAAWRAHRDAARATMVDTANALLLHPARPASGFRSDAPERPPRRALIRAPSFEMDGRINGRRGATAIPDRLIVATIHYFDAPIGPDLADRLERALASAGAPILASFVTEHGANTFPALPVREGKNVFVCFARFADRSACDRFRANLAGSPEYQAILSKASARTEVLTLSPTARSQLR